MKIPAVIGIIGGSGKMGQVFASYINKYSAEFKENIEILIGSRKGDLSNIDIAKKSDMLIITVPIRNTMDIIKEVGPYMKENSLITDFTSVKELPVEYMVKFSKCGVVGGHPIFGPITDIRGQNFVVCDIRPSEFSEWYLKFLEYCGLIIIETTPEQHDRAMSIVQCLTHISSITTGYVLKKSGFDVNVSEKFASPIYRIELNMTGRILEQDPKLYSDIQMYNPYSKEILDIQLKCLLDLKQAVDSKDQNKFEEIFKNISEYLGEFCNKAKIESDYLIKKMVERYI